MEVLDMYIYIINGSVNFTIIFASAVTHELLYLL